MSDAWGQGHGAGSIGQGTSADTYVNNAGRLFGKFVLLSYGSTGSTNLLHDSLFLVHYSIFLIRFPSILFTFAPIFSRMKTSRRHKSHQVSQGKVLVTVGLNLLITLVEFAGGILSNSLALISDALHNLSDTFAIVISYIALKTSKRSSTARNTFGFKRIEILAALFNATVLIAVSIFLFFEAYHRLADPKPIRGGMMFWVALVGLLANLISVFLLRKDADHNLNIRTAYLHLFGDTLSSVAVITGAVLIRFWNIYWIDPVLTFLIGLFIIKETWSILRETIEILMEATPRDLDLEQIKMEMEKHPKISNIHHIHAWRLNDTEVYFQCHADVSDNMPILETNKVREELEEILVRKFDIDHVTIQVEYQACHDKDSISDS